MNEAEHRHLKEQVAISGFPMEVYLRALIAGEKMRPRPPNEYAEIRRQLAAIGNNINQLALKANALGFIDTPMLKAEALRWHRFQADIEAVFLRPGESNLKWQ